MAESIIKVSSTASGDMDFLAFSFNGKHSWDDFGIYRVGDGDRYNENLLPTMADKTAEVSGGNGMYFFGTNHKQKDFNINFAFDHLTDFQVKEMKKWLNGKEMGDLWFEEAPYKVWTAKVTGQPNIKYIPFDDFDENGNKIRVYRGEGSIVFTAYWPYAHTPEAVLTLDGEARDGKSLSAYDDFYNKEEWATASGLTEEVTPNLVVGDLPAYFTASLTPYTLAELVCNENNTICYGYKYNSSTDSEKALIIKPTASVSSLEKDEALEGGITWNVGGGYNENPMNGLYAIDLSNTNITSIPDYCFATTENTYNTIIDIKLPKTLTYLGDMFTARSQLGINAENCKYDTYLTDNGVSLDYGKYINGNSKTLYNLGKINRSKSSFAIQDGTKFLASYCCYECEAKHIIVPEGVLEICAGAFSGCKNLASVTIPKTVTHINKWVFNDTPRDLIVYFNGTKNEYKNVNKDGQSGVSDKTTICTDGQYSYS